MSCSARHRPLDVVDPRLHRFLVTGVVVGIAVLVCRVSLGRVALCVLAAAGFLMRCLGGRAVVRVALGAARRGRLAGGASPWPR
eukprot:7882926-Pyramimonas_sp.AAC.1